jgi:hypothetical protein
MFLLLVTQPLGTDGWLGISYLLLQGGFLVIRQVHSERYIMCCEEHGNFVDESACLADDNIGMK